MSRIYASGVKATALTQILADLAGYLSYDAGGVLVLDVDGLDTYLKAQAELISTGAEYVAPATAATSLAKARAVDTRALVASLNDQIKRERWSARADWPTSTSVLQGPALVSAIKAGMAETKRRSDALASFYSDIDQQLESRFTEFYYTEGIDSSVPAGVVRLIETRCARYTWVTDRGEESAMSPPSLLAEIDQNDTATYTAAAAPGGRSISLVRWYRSTQGTTNDSFNFVVENAVATLTYTDSKKAAELGEVCPSETWDEPPATLQGIVAGPNGANAGFVDNTFMVSENFMPHAWPTDYRKTAAWPIVGIGTYGQTYVVLTRGKPYLATGADSASLTWDQVDSNQVCVSRRGIVSSEGGVLFPSADGICLASQGGFQIISGELFDIPTWRALVPSSIIAAEQDGAYVFAYNTGSATGCYSLDIKSGKLTTVDITASAFYRDLITDTLYYSQGTAIKAFATNTSKRTAVWRSKKIVLPQYANFGWLQVDSDYESAVTVKLYANGTLVNTDVLTSRAPVRVYPTDDLEYEVQVESAAKVTSVTYASSSSELRQV